ncbi:hypothetical protein [Pseudomonas phage vB_PsaM_M1]|nr:hypothetical protein [Pseudomonas phage vB_PsaM_M1]
MLNVVGFGDFFKRGNPFYWQMLNTQDPPIFSILDLFDSGEQGVWYDPDDLSSLYQDVTGSIPVTAAGQPVGLMLDKKFGLVRGNELAVNGNFENTSNWTLSVPVQISGSKLRFNSAFSNANATQAGIVEAGKDYEISYTVDSVTSGSIGIEMLGVGGFIGPSISTAGTYKTILTAGANNSVSIVSKQAGTTAVIDNISVRALPGSHAGIVTPSSKPILRFNATTGSYYLEVDGTDDWMSTPAMPFSATDKVAAFAGIRKLNDTESVLFELGTNVDSTNGSFAVLTGGTTQKFRMSSRGTATSTAAITDTAYNAPLSSVIHAVGDISGDLASVAVNDSVTITSATDQGTGNYGNHQLYLFRRNATSLYFSGNFYGMVLVGRLCTGSEQVSVKSILANKVGV